MKPLKTSLFLASLLLLPACVADQAVELESRSIALDQNAEPSGVAGPLSAASVAKLLPATGPTYVTLTVSQPEANGSFLRVQQTSPITSGSGFVVSEDGYVLTAAHVGVAKGNEVSARAANGRAYSGNVVAVLRSNDMALVKLRSFTGRSVIPASAGCVATGDVIYTLGKPHGMGDTARIGTMQSKHFGRAVTYGKFGYPDALVLHMGTQRGESGGPVFNKQGQLIGMVVSTLSDESGKSINTAHAIPANQLGAYLCSMTQCSETWAAVARTNVDSCG